MMLTALVMDTNVVLDCFVFKDPAAMDLCARLMSKKVRWIATQPMLEEYLRVLTYPAVARHLLLLEDKEQVGLPQVFACYAEMLPPPVPPSIQPFASVVCADKDDQMFVDLALAHQVVLLSKDHEVLKLNGRKGLQVLDLKRYAVLGEKFECD